MTKASCVYRLYKILADQISICLEETSQNMKENNFLKIKVQLKDQEFIYLFIYF